MPDFLSFFQAILNAICEFLLTEPISYFTGIIVLSFIAGLVHYIIRGRR